MEPENVTSVRIMPELNDALEPHQAGYMYATRDASGRWVAEVLLRSDVPPDDLITALSDGGQIADWLVSALDQLAATGDPAYNGWCRSDQGPDLWYMILAGHRLA